MPLEYFVIALLAVAAILLASALAILFPHLRREAQADAAETRALRAKATEPDRESAG
jgi:hypothetical protein